MPELKHNFTAGRMNKDLDERLVPKGEYRHAENIEVMTSEDSNIGSVQTSLGNILVSDMLPAEKKRCTPACVGSVVDEKNNKAYYFLSGKLKSTAQLAIFKTEHVVGSDLIIEYDQHLDRTTPVVVDIYEVRIDGQAGLPYPGSSFDEFDVPITSPGAVNGPVEGLRPGMILSEMVGTPSQPSSTPPSFLPAEEIIITEIFPSTTNPGTHYTIRLSSNITGVTSSEWLGLSYIVFESPRFLNFDPHHLITGINIIDDMLFWTDNRYEPKKVNIKRGIEGSQLNHQPFYLQNSKNNTVHTLLIVNDGLVIDYFYTGIPLGPMGYPTALKEEHITVLKKSPLTPPMLDTSSIAERRNWANIPTPITTTIGGPNSIAPGGVLQNGYSWAGVLDGNTNLWSAGASRPLYPVGTTSIDANNTTNWGYDPVNFPTLTDHPNPMAWLDEPVNFQEGDILLVTDNLDGHTINDFVDYQVKLRVISSNSTPSNQQLVRHPNSGNFNFEIVAMDPGITREKRMWYVRLDDQNKPLYELKFSRFAYRYKYEDGEYSSFSPFSEPAFLTDEFDYHPSKGFNLGMVNALKRLFIKDFVPENIPDDVVEVDLLYKESNMPQVYTVRSFKKGEKEWDRPGTGNNKGSFEIKSDLIHGLVESIQLLRPWDNVPRKALAQEVVGNRLIYGNYIQNYSIHDKRGKEIKPEFVTSISSKEVDTVKHAEKSLKSYRNYQLGIVYKDTYGRETPVLSHTSGVVKVGKAGAPLANQIITKIKTTAPSWAESFKFFIKETSNEYYNLPMGRWYEAEKDHENPAHRAIWLAFPSEDRNKVDEETTLILKKGTDSDTFVEDTPRYKILAIKNEAPEWIKTTKRLIGFCDMGTTASATANTDLGNFFHADGCPLVGGTRIYFTQVGWEDSTFSSLQNKENEILSGSTDDRNSSLMLRIYDGTSEGGGIASKWYDITNISYKEGSDYSNKKHYEIDIDGIFGTDMLFTTINGSNSATHLIGNLRVEIAKKTVENKPEFDGRFFVKIHSDEHVEEILTQANQDPITTLHYRTVYSQKMFYYGFETQWDDNAGPYGEVVTTNDTIIPAYPYTTNAGAINNNNGGGTLPDLPGYPYAYKVPYRPQRDAISPTQTPNKYEWARVVEHDCGTYESPFPPGQVNPPSRIWSGFEFPFTNPSVSINSFHRSPNDWGTLIQTNSPWTNSLSVSGAYSHGWPGGLSDPSDTGFFIDHEPTVQRVYPSNDLGRPEAADTFDVPNQNLLPDNTVNDGQRTFSYSKTGVGIQLGSKLLDISWSGLGPNDVPLTGFIQAANQPGNPWDIGHAYNFPQFAEFLNTHCKIGSRFYWSSDPDRIIYTIINRKTTDNLWNWGSHIEEPLSTVNPSTSCYGEYQPAGDQYNHPIRKRVRIELELNKPHGFGAATTNFNSTGKPYLPINPSYYDPLGPDTGQADENTTVSMVFVEDYNDPHRNDLPTNPAIWETEPKEDVELDIYYEASKAYPVVLEEKTAQNYISDGALIEMYEPNLNGFWSNNAWVNSNFNLISTPSSVLNPAGTPTEIVDYIVETNSSSTVNPAGGTAVAAHKHIGHTHVGPNGPLRQYVVLEDPINPSIQRGNYVKDSQFSANITAGTYVNNIFPPLGNNPKYWVVQLNQNVVNVLPKGTVLEFEANPTWSNTHETAITKIPCRTHSVQGAAGDHYPIGGPRSTRIEFTVPQILSEGDVLSFTNPDGSVVLGRVAFDTDNSFSGRKETYIDSDVHNLQRQIPYFNCYSFGNGVESNRIRDLYNAPLLDKGVKASTTLAEQYKEERRGSGLIFSGIYNSMNGVNRLNQFIMAENITKDLNPTYGTIQKLHTRDSDIITLCEDKVLKILAYKDALFNADDTKNITAIPNVLGNSIPYVGEYGISKNPESFASEAYRSYFTDQERGVVLRLSRDGLTPISGHGMKDWFSDAMLNNNQPVGFPDHKHNMVGNYDSKKSHYNITLRGPDFYNRSHEDYGLFKTVSFSEKASGWVSFRSWANGETGFSLNNKYYTAYEGRLWEHHVKQKDLGFGNIFNVDRNSFYSETGSINAESSITFLFNDFPSTIKSFTTLNYEGSQSRIIQNDQVWEGGDSPWAVRYDNDLSIDGWYVDLITTDQQTGTVAEFIKKEGKWFNYIYGEETMFKNHLDPTTGFIPGGVNSGNVDTKEFSVQGIATLESIILTGGGGGGDPVTGPTSGTESSSVTQRGGGNGIDESPSRDEAPGRGDY